MDKVLGWILADIYRRLYARFGPQHWWPADGSFEVIVGAILTQNTAWTNVEKAIYNLKAAGKLSPRALRDIPETELAALIRPAGYYNAKARRLKAFADWSGERYNDSLEKMLSGDIQIVRRELLGVYGIGEETADSIMLYAGNNPVFVIDAYTCRIIDRLGLEPPGNGYGAYQSLFMLNLPPDARLFNEYHALLVKLGKEYCRKRPLCEGCCLREGCKRVNQKPKIKSQSLPRA
jgi:endonuclease-3 related protein